MFSNKWPKTEHINVARVCYHENQKSSQSKEFGQIKSSKRVLII
jgi:hypothetical protein